MLDFQKRSRRKNTFQIKVVVLVLVRAGSSIKPQISSATNAACNSNSKVTHWVSCRPPWTVEEGDIASFFVKDLGLALAPKMCPDQSQAFKEVNNSNAFTVGQAFKDVDNSHAFTVGRNKWTHVFLDQPLAGAPRHVCTFEELTA